MNCEMCKDEGLFPFCYGCGTEPERKGWRHFSDSPWGDVDICDDGVVRPHGSTEKICVFCDWPEDANMELKKCEVCFEENGSAFNWHLDGVCLRTELHGSKNND